MEFEEFKKQLKNKMKLIDIELDDVQVNKFFDYMTLLLEWNKKMNLTAIIGPSEIILKHFVDSASILKYINKNSTLIDIGTGAGFPGIPLKILREDINITLMDSLNKRVNFLNEIVNTLKLEKICAIHARAEELAQNKKFREKFDYATSRAVANIATLSEYMIPFVKVGGKAIIMKASNVEAELKNGEKAINVLGGKIEDVIEFNLPDSDIGRNVILVSKEFNTLKKYPRKAGTPSKEPII